MFLYGILVHVYTRFTVRLEDGDRVIDIADVEEPEDMNTFVLGVYSSLIKASEAFYDWRDKQVIEEGLCGLEGCPVSHVSVFSVTLDAPGMEAPETLIPPDRPA
jgi:hypothetical protein